MASNTFSGILPTIIAQSLPALRENAVISRLCNRDYANAPAEQGDVVNVTLPSSFSASDVSPQAAPSDGSGSTPVKVAITLNRWRKVSMAMTDKEVGQITAGIAPAQMTEMVRTLANDVNSYAYGLYKRIFNIAGTAGTNPFNSGSTAAIRDARALLEKNLAPRSDRRVILTPDAEAQALGASDIVRWDGRGTGAAIDSGIISKTYGMDWYSDQLLPTHTSTALTAGAATINGAQAINAGSTDGGRTGTISIAKATNSAPLVQGDIIEFTVGGVVQQHTVITGVTLAVGNTTVTVAPALRVATAGGETVTLRATHGVNFVFHRDALWMASRPLSTLGGDNTYSVADPVTGLVLRAEIVRQDKQTKLEFDILYGFEWVRPEWAVRLAQ